MWVRGPPPAPFRLEKIPSSTSTDFHQCLLPQDRHQGRPRQTTAVEGGPCCCGRVGNALLKTQAPCRCARCAVPDGEAAVQTLGFARSARSSTRPGFHPVAHARVLGPEFPPHQGQAPPASFQGPGAALAARSSTSEITSAESAAPAKVELRPISDCALSHLCTPPVGCGSARPPQSPSQCHLPHQGACTWRRVS